MQIVIVWSMRLCLMRVNHIAPVYCQPLCLEQAQGTLKMYKQGADSIANIQAMHIATCVLASGSCPCTGMSGAPDVGQGHNAHCDPKILSRDMHACRQRTLLGVGTTLMVSSVRSPGACSRRRPPGGACPADPGRGAIGANVRVDTPTWLGPARRHVRTRHCHARRVSRAACVCWRHLHGP